MNHNNSNRPKPTQFYDFGIDFNPQRYKIHGYLQGERIYKPKGISFSLFDFIFKLRESENVNNGKTFIHAIGQRIKENTITILIIEKL